MQGRRARRALFLLHAVCLPSPTSQYFKGIPYAGSTAPPHRFMPPQPLAPWSGTLNATAFAPGCVQSHHNPDVPAQQSEDCLNLNIYAPAGTKAGDALPVMAFIHGGAFEEGSNRGPFDMYEANYIVQQHKVVYVTLNYRLGAFGWLSAGDAVPGNMGLLDQRAALQWVHDNIAFFGGNPSAVTVQGESAGAMSIGLHLVSPGSKGLFKRAIQESGVTGYPYRDSTEQAAYGMQFCKALQCDVAGGSPPAARALRGRLAQRRSTPKQWMGRFALLSQAQRQQVAAAVWASPAAQDILRTSPVTSATALAQDFHTLAQAAPLVYDAAVDTLVRDVEGATCNVTCLQGATSDAVKHAAGEATKDILSIIAANWGHLFSAFLSWTPTVDGTIVPMNQVPAMQAGAFDTDVDLLVTTNTNEGATFVYAAVDFEVPSFLIPLAYDLLWGEEASKNISKNALYDASKFADGRTPLSHVTTDHLFRCPAQLWASAVNAHGRSAFVGRYNHLWSFSWLFAKFGLPSICTTEVCHAAELPAVFHAVNTTGRANNITFTPAEMGLSAAMVQYWTNFAATGNPNTYPEGEDARVPLPMEWPQWTPSSQVDLSLNTTWTTETTPQCAMWDAIGYSQKND